MLQLQPDSPRTNLITSPVTGAVGSSLANQVRMLACTCENLACDENSSQNANQMMGAEKVSSPSLQKDEDTTSNSKPGSSNVSGSISSKEQPSQQNIGLLFKNMPLS
jgi:hypothetical protein